MLRVLYTRIRASKEAYASVKRGLRVLENGDARAAHAAGICADVRCCFVKRAHAHPHADATRARAYTMRILYNIKRPII